MKVLYVHELFPPETVGGGEIYAENIVMALKKRKIKVQVVTGTRKKARNGMYKGVRVHRVNFKPTRYLFNVKAVSKIEEVVEKFKPDIIHANAFQACLPAFAAAKKYEIPIIVNVHFFFQKYYRNYFGPIRSRIFARIERYVMKHSYDKVIALDKYVYNNLKKFGVNSVLIEHPINTKLFKPKKKPKKFTIGTAMTMGKSKRNDIFINFAKKHRDEFDFVAVGFYKKRVKKKLQRTGIKTIGRLEHHDMNKFYNSIHVYIGHGMAAKEAMSCGAVAILNEDVKRLKQYHEKELNKNVMQKGNIYSIVKKLQNKKYYNKLSKRSSQFVKKNYSEEKIMKKIINEYKKLIK